MKRKISTTLAVTLIASQVQGLTFAQEPADKNASQKSENITLVKDTDKDKTGENKTDIIVIELKKVGK